jgi:CheY-like chemotaxis protein
MPAAPALAESAPARFSGVVLLVEDNPINQLVASEMLQLLGVEVVCAADGVEGLEMFESHRFDLVLMDIQMPRMDGLEATREIRRREKLGSHAETPIIALTANASEEERRRSLDAGMNDFLAKPVKTEQIAAVLARYLGAESS